MVLSTFSPNNSTFEEYSKKTYTFDINIALIGYVSVGKSTVLNALLGDKFSQVALKRTTAGVNFFRIHQPTESNDLNQRHGWSIIVDDDKKLKEAEVVHEEISKDNEELRSSWIVEEKVFDIQVRYPICKGLRDDTRLVLIDIPGINEAESSKKYKEYVESNWKNFDCVVVVMDAIQGVNTQEQVDLLEFVHRNNQERKNVPTIVLGNKMDDLDDEDTLHQIEETCSKTMEIFGNVDCRYKTTETDQNEGKDNAGDETTTAFIPLSAKNAFMYMKAANIDLDQLADAKYQDLVTKIGIDEYGRKFSKMTPEDKINAVTEVFKNPNELYEKLQDTNFHSFLSALSEFVGDDEEQKEILGKKISTELSDACSNSLGAKSICMIVLEAWAKLKAIGVKNHDWMKETFWEVYRDLENKTFEANSGMIYTDPKAMQRLFEELKQYLDLTVFLEWVDESPRAAEAMKNLLQRQLTFLLEKLEGWDFQSYCRSTGGENYCPNMNIQTSPLGKIVRTGSDGRHEYYIIGSFSGMKWKNGWKRWRTPEDFKWLTLSPQDWIVILESLSLMWNERLFVREFGPEKVKLAAALAKFHNAFIPLSGIDLDLGSCDGPNGTDRICLHAYKQEIRKRGKGGARSMAQISMPRSLDDPSHWGYLASRYIGLCSNANYSATV